MSATKTNWRGVALNEELLTRGFLPLLNPWTGAVTLYRCTRGARLTDLELANLSLERAAIEEYLRGLAL